jgi:hypothetical protein
VRPQPQGADAGELVDGAGEGGGLGPRGPSRDTRPPPERTRAGGAGGVPCMGGRHQHAAAAGLDALGDGDGSAGGVRNPRPQAREPIISECHQMQVGPSQPSAHEK